MKYLRTYISIGNTFVCTLYATGLGSRWSLGKNMVSEEWTVEEVGNCFLWGKKNNLKFNPLSTGSVTKLITHAMVPFELPYSTMQIPWYLNMVTIQFGIRKLKALTCHGDSFF